MVKEVNAGAAAHENSISAKLTHEETSEHLDEFNRTKKIVTDLLNYKRSLIDLEHADYDKINEIKGRAIEAINILFNDIIRTKGS
ncbi:MAG: hypothetical protein PSX36_00765 [bacterium]|nr:hypothetical protein [bacterium]